VLRCLGRILTIIALCCAIGLQWIVLQSVAWTAMIVDHAKRATLCQAIEQTFDGAHPCSLCHAVSKGKTSERKSEAQASATKIDILCVARRIQLKPRVTLLSYTTISCSNSERVYSPPSPPPRTARI
jgi:hypothetical protein